ncbi:isoprenylcysteine carboxylmethyltransferase family protein [candidate division KSB1 bacterium]|nr:isoprenylcysteine carboxylmethyltransferase family protein [candidate division KSB1 bacterium]
MNHEATFRLIFIAVFALSFSISGYHRHHARKQSGKIPRQAEGKSFIALRLLLAVPLYLAMFAYMINPQWMAWSALPLPAWLHWLGAGLGFAMIPLLYWLFRSLGKNVSETVLTKERHELITHGPYRWIRHPLYTVASIGIFALGLLAANWFMLLMILLIMATLPALVAKEEAQLIEKFGNAYREYMQRTGRFLPRLKS